MKLLVVILLFFTSGIYAQNNERIVNLEEWNNAVNFLRENAEWQDADSASIIVVESLIRAELLGHENPIHDSLLLLNLIREYCYSNQFYQEELYRELKLLALYSPYLTHHESEELTRKAGEVYYIFGDYELAKEFFKKSLSYHNLKVESYLLGRIGRCFLDLKNLDSALIYYEHALMLSKNETERIGNANSVGYTSFLNRDYRKANIYYQKALDLFSNNHESIDSIQYFIVQSNLASLKLETGYIDEGVHKLESIAYLNSLFLKKYKWYAKEIYRKLVDHYIEVKDCHNSEKYLSKLREIFKDASNNSGLILYLESEVRSALLCNKTAEARKAFILYEKKRKEYQAHVDKQRMMMGKMQYDLFSEQLRNNQESLELKNAFEVSLKKTNARLIWVTIIVVCLLLMVASFSIWYVRNKRSVRFRKEALLKLNSDLLVEKERTAELKVEIFNEELKNKKHELSQLLGTAELHSDLHNEIQNRLEKIRLAHSDENGEIAQLLQFVKSIGKTEEINKLIFNSPDLIDGKFKERIEKQFPELSRGEMQMVIFIKLRLSNKEMAQIKNVESGSVRIFKSRLKKKLNVPADLTLSEFINTLY
ncbi:MAG: tetratricopeptide repeat protein [Crocinitomicaceae bacterium]|nr:tetratricopeptide repeat protein [Flavobacteriales bacterium]NQZ34326.1 tetratricopeptide repeat protein [Crocinitomicaceae bacterium]